MAIMRNASILFACTMAGNVANYCFQFAMGRALSMEEFGAMNALLSVVTSITLPTSAVMMVIAKYASTYKVAQAKAEIGSLYRLSLKNVGLFALATSATYLFLSRMIMDYLKIDGLLPVMILAIGIFGSFIMTVNLGMLQGLQRFYYLGAGIGLGGVLRLVLGIAFLVAGLKLNGALLATVLPTLFLFFITAAPLSSYLTVGGRGAVHENIMGYSVPVLIASLAFAFLTNIDLIMVKHYMEARQAGLYASASVLGKTMLYLPSSFALAVFPMVREADLLNGDSFKILDRALIATSLMCAAGIAMFALIPEVIVSILFGERFSEASGYLKYYGTAMAMMSVLSILISFNLARGRTSFVYSLIVGCVLTAGAITAFHSSIKEVVISIAAVFSALTAYNLLLAYRGRSGLYRQDIGGQAAVFSADKDEA